MGVNAVFWRLALLTAIAGAGGFAVGNIVPGMSAAVVAITALVTVQPTAYNALQQSILQVIGIIMGAAAAAITVALLGFNTFTILVAIVVSFVIVAVLRLGKATTSSPASAASSIAVTAIVVVGSHLTEEDIAMRFLSVVVGAVIGLLLSAFTSSRIDITALESQIDDINQSASLLVADIADGVDRADFDYAVEWKRRASALRAEAIDLAKKIEDLDKSSRFSPFLSRDAVLRLLRRADGLRVTTTRLEAVTNDLYTARRKDLLVNRPEALTPLAELFEQAAQTLDPEAKTPSRAGVQEKVRDVVGAVGDDTEEALAVSAIAKNAAELLSKPTIETGLLPVIVDESDTAGPT